MYLVWLASCSWHKEQSFMSNKQRIIGQGSQKALGLQIEKRLRPVSLENITKIISILKETYKKTLSTLHETDNTDGLVFILKGLVKWLRSAAQVYHLTGVFNALQRWLFVGRVQYYVYDDTPFPLWPLVRQTRKGSGHLHFLLQCPGILPLYWP